MDTILPKAPGLVPGPSFVIHQRKNTTDRGGPEEEPPEKSRSPECSTRKVFLVRKGGRHGTTMSVFGRNSEATAWPQDRLEGGKGVAGICNNVAGTFVEHLQGQRETARPT